MMVSDELILVKQIALAFSGRDESQRVDLVGKWLKSRGLSVVDEKKMENDILQIMENINTHATVPQTYSMRNDEIRFSMSINSYDYYTMNGDSVNELYHKIENSIMGINEEYNRNYKFEDVYIIDIRKDYMMDFFIIRFILSKKPLPDRERLVNTNTQYWYDVFKK